MFVPLKNKNSEYNENYQKNTERSERRKKEEKHEKKENLVSDDGYGDGSRNPGSRRRCAECGSV